MAIRVFLSHASADKPFVVEVKKFLDDGGEIECWLDSFEIDLGQNFVSRINDGLTKADAVVLFLSPTSLRSRWVEEEWTAAIARDTRLIPALIGDGEPPALLQNRQYVDLRSNQLEGMRRLKSSMLQARPVPKAAPTTGASLPYFVGREAEIAQLRERLSQPGALVPIIGMPGLGKSYLAREFIRRHGALFEAVYELDCQKKDLAALTGELAAQLGLRFQGEPPEVAAEQRNHLSRKRCLLLLDNVDDDQPGQLVPGGRATVLVTARDQTIAFLAEYKELSPALLTDAEALLLFREILGAFPEDAAKKLFAKLGYLPLAVTVSAGLIKHDLRYTVKSLADALPPLEKLAHGKSNVGRVLSAAIAALRENERLLLAAFAACAPQGARLTLASGIAELTEPDSFDALQELFRRSLIEEIDRDARRYRVHPLLREAAAPSMEIRRKHAEQIDRGLAKWATDPPAFADLIEESEECLRVAALDGELLLSIASRAGHLARSLGRLGQALEFYRRVEDAANNDNWRARSYNNQGLIFHAWGRSDEAMQLFNKAETMWLKVADRNGLQASYGNLALVLTTLGRFDEALALNQKKEAICLELNDRGSLQVFYGNQAGILRSWRKFDEAMDLLKKQEAICVELGDREGLQRCYGEQALVLREQGRIDDAVALHRKEEEICIALGDRVSLAYCYWNWGQIEHEKLTAALALFTELQMPQQREKVQKDLAGVNTSPNPAS